MYVNISKIVEEVVNNLINKLEELNKENFIELEKILENIHTEHNKVLLNKIKLLYVKIFNEKLQKDQEKELKLVEYIFNNDNYLDSILNNLIKEKNINIDIINKELKKYLNNQKKLKYFENIIEMTFFPEQAKIRDYFKYMPF